MTATLIKVMEEGIITAVKGNDKFMKLPRGRGSPTIRWEMVQPAMPTNSIITACMGPEEAKRKQDILNLGLHSAKTQEAYRHLHHGIRSLAKTTGQSYSHITPVAQSYLQQTYDTHMERLNYKLHDAFKNGTIIKNVLYIKVRLELQELLATGEKEKVGHRRAARASSAKAFADKTKGLRRAFAAARPPRQPPMICIRHNNIPCFYSDSIDKAYDDQVGNMFEGETGGFRRRVPRAAVFIDEYADVIHTGAQFPSKPINSIAIHSIITSAGSVAASFDHLYLQ